ncbi:S1 family peptidase [Gigaspora margarita]|uniref:S1 family peptidase n=1 Tax=Gigaspora margarita TaxID=4874 RepID=A0A8H4AVA0_GIGMA|nr:S1 family peptidase [Gigaspora margarita]
MRIYFLIVLLSLLQSYSIYAEQDHPLAKLWGVEDNEVPKLLENERNLIAIDKILKSILEQDNFISSFGGSVIFPKENIITVNTVDFSKVDDLLALPQINPHKDFLSFDKAENSMSLSQLIYNFDQIAFQASSIRPNQTIIYTDLESNNNVIYIFNRDINNSEFIEAIKPYNPKIIYENINSPPVSQNITQLRRDFNPRNLKIKLLSGDGLYNNGLFCSAGFWATDRFDPNDFYVITAGHCYNNEITNTEFYYAPWRYDLPSDLLIGRMVFHMTDPYDFGIINHVNKDVIPTFSVRNDVTTKYRELTITDSAPVTSVGAHICRSGRTSYFSCGYVLGFNGRNYGYTIGIKKDLIITDMPAERGDSGGPILSFVSPQNLYSVVVHGIFFGGGRILNAAQSIDIIFKELGENTIYDLTLYTGGSSS